jgi:hypothetical protein
MKRTIALGAAWTASAAAAVGLGFLAVSLVDASADPGTSPVASTTSAAEASTSATPTAPPSATSAAGQYATPGGTVYADCTGGTPVLAGVPAAGWSTDDSPEPGQVEFRNGNQKVEVRVTCVGAIPSFSRDDSSSPVVTPSPSSTAGGSDHGGHGAEDPAGDSSGRSGGGHGQDG